MDIQQLEKLRQNFLDQLEQGQAPAGYSWPEYQQHLLQMINQLTELIGQAKNEMDKGTEIISGAYT